MRHVLHAPGVRQHVIVNRGRLAAQESRVLDLDIMVKVGYLFGRPMLQKLACPNDSVHVCLAPPFSRVPGGPGARWGGFPRLQESRLYDESASKKHVPLIRGLLFR